MRKFWSISLQATHDSYIYDQETDCLRYRLEDNQLGEEVKPIGYDVYGEALVVIGDIEVPVYAVINTLESLDPEDLLKYPDKEWGYFTDDNIPSQERVKELFDYDDEKGVLLHKVHRSKVKVGTVAGSKPRSPKKPLSIRIDGHQFPLHRIVYLWHKGLYTEEDIRHRDGDKTNNRIENLYSCSRRDTNRTRPTPEDSWSGVRGVQLGDIRKKPWNALIKVDKVISLGCYEELTDAVKARWEAECKYGWIDCRSTSPAYLYLKEHDPAYLDKSSCG